MAATLESDNDTWHALHTTVQHISHLKFQNKIIPLITGMLKVIHINITEITVPIKVKLVSNNAN